MRLSPLFRGAGVYSNILVRYSSYGGASISSNAVTETIESFRKLAKPDQVYVCDGSSQEKDELIASLVEAGTLEALPAREGSYLALSDPLDVARVEKQTYICSEKEEDAGPTNNWKDPAEMKAELQPLFDGCMKGRTMYVVPFSMGAVGGPLSKLGLQLTDSAYVALSMRTMTRMGKEPLQLIEKQDMKDVVPCFHTVGAPNSDAPWPCNSTKYIVHYPEEPSIWSFGSGYGGNALLGKKCLALRIASSVGKREGWLAEHMVIMSVELEETGETKYICAAFPSGCGKTNLAMLNPSIPGMKIKTIGDDIAWLKWGDDGKLWAINPENGFFGVAPGTSDHTNPEAMATIEKNTIFTNVAKTPDGDVWWEGMTKEPPANLTDWKGQPWTPSSKTPAAHPNSRFCTPIAQAPTLDEEGFNSAKGVPIDAILFGGRRATTIPLVTEATDFDHGVFMGAAVASEQTATAEGVPGELRHDPFAMLPFCGYNMGDYFQHWLDMGKGEGKQLPKFFGVNWFRKNSEGKFAWPGFGDNARVLKWIVQRLDDPEDKLATKSAIGYLPKPGSLDLDGIKEDTSELFKVDSEGWKRDLKAIRSYFGTLGPKVPSELTAKIDEIEKKL